MPNWKKVITSGSDGILNSLNLTSTGSGQTVLDIQGSQGQLFSITDDLTGDIFSISDISGVPIFNINASGATTFDGYVPDNSKLKFGDSGDLEIYHDGSNSYIDETGAGSLYIKSAGAIRLQSDTGENMIYAVNDGAVNLYHNNSNKLQTTSTGVTVTGNTTFSGFVLDGNTITGINDSGEFDDNDSHIMTSAGVNDRIDTRISGLTSNTGTVTGVTSGNAFTITIGGTSTAPTVAANTAAVTNGGGNLATGDHIYDHVTSRISGLTSNTGTTTASNTQTFTNKSGNISQWTNNSGYTTNTGTTTASNTQTFTNKSGNISQWTNNSGYITSFTNTVDMGDGFIIEDGDGTEVRITENKEVKFKEGTGIDINWTDTSTGSDGDPYDLTITNTAPAGSTHLNSNTTKSDVGLSNVANESRATILGGDLTGKINGIAVADVTDGAAKGATSNQDSTSTIRSGTTKANVGLSNVANESRATILASAALTGNPTAPTQAANNNSTRIATTAYVQGEITDLIGGAPGALDTLNEIAEAINDDSSYASTITSALGGKSPTAGNTSLTTVGTISTGIWQGTAIADAYLSTNTAHLSGTQTFSGNKTFSGTLSATSGVKLTGIDASSESKSVMIDGSGVLSVRSLGSNAFNSTTIPTNNSQLTNGAGFTTNTGTTTPSNSQTFTNKGGNISQWTNDSGYITSFTNTVDMGDGFKVQDGDGTNVTITENKYLKFVEGTGIDINFTDTNGGSSSDPFDLTITNTITNNNQLDNGRGYITGVTNISGNAGTATLAADSTLAGGLAIGTGRNNSANQIVRTQANGYAEFGWINTTSGNTTSTITDIYVNTNDGYIRKATQSHFKSQLALSNVDNKSSSTIRGEITSANVTSALGFTPTTNTGTLTGNGTDERVPFYNGTTSFTSTNKFTFSSNTLTIPSLTVSTPAILSSEATSLMINSSGVVGTRELGSNAFNSTTIPTNNTQLTNGSGFTTNTGTVTNVTVGAGLDISNSSTTPAISLDLTEIVLGVGLDAEAATALSLDLSEFADMTANVVPTTDEIILLDNGAERRKRFSEIFGSNAYNSTTIPTNNNQITNGRGFTTNTGTITGDGTSNFLPKFNSTQEITNSEISDTGALVKIGNDASNRETLYIDTTNRKVGFRTSSPGAAFDVNGTIRVRNQLNVGHTSEKNLFVNGNGSAGGQYVQIGDYKVPSASHPNNGNYFGITGAENQPKYSIGVGNGGKIVQDMRIMTVKLSGNAFKNLSTTGTTLIPAPGADYFILPYTVTIHNTGGAKGSWSATDTAAIGFKDTNSGTYPNQFNKLFAINKATLQLNNTAFTITQAINNTGKYFGTNKALMLKASNDLTKEGSSTPAGTWYIQIRYQLVNKTAGIINNVDKTLTGNS